MSCWPGIYLRKLMKDTCAYEAVTPLVCMVVSIDERIYVYHIQIRAEILFSISNPNPTNDSFKI